MKKFRIKGVEEIFENSGDAYEFCMENEISLEDVEEIEPEDIKTYCKSHPEDPRCKKIHGEIEESPKEENVDEDSVVMTDSAHEELEWLQYIVEHWDEISIPDKRAVLSVAFGIESGHRKHFPEKTKLISGKVKPILKKDVGETLGRYHLSKMLKKIELGQCPICDEHHSQDAFWKNVKLPEELSDFFAPSIKAIKENPSHFTKQAKARSPKMFTREKKIACTIQHIKSRHVKIYALLKDLFEKEKSERKYDDTEKSDQAQHLSKDKENLDLEELSREELAYEFSVNPELRRQILRIYKKQLKERT